jgi:hypothetical protein
MVRHELLIVRILIVGLCVQAYATYVDVQVPPNTYNQSPKYAYSATPAFLQKVEYKVIHRNMYTLPNIVIDTLKGTL